MNSSGSGGRDRNKHRQYDSGAAKRKAKEERGARESDVFFFCKVLTMPSGGVKGPAQP